MIYSITNNDPTDITAKVTIGKLTKQLTPKREYDIMNMTGGDVHDNGERTQNY